MKLRIGPWWLLLLAAVLVEGVSAIAVLHGAPLARGEATPPPPLGLASYPSWRSPRCRSGGEFFCDPEGLLSEEARHNITDALHLLRATTEVECGQLASVLAGQDRKHRRHFRLGVAIAEDWPATEADPAALQQFGLVLMAQWGLMPIYNGVDADNGVREEAFTRQHHTANCPSAAVLIILPRFHQAFLSAPSCEFICGERGGPEVAHAALLALDSGDLAAAAQAGIRQVSRILRETAPLSLESPDVASAKKRVAARAWAREGFWRGEVALVVAQRACLAVAIASAALGILALAAYGLAPAPRKSPPMAAAAGL